MSYHRFSIIQGRAVGDKRVSDSQLRTLSAIGMYADKDGWCWPSQSTIAEDTGKTRKTINEHIASLCEFGYLEKHWVENGDKSQMKYRLLFDTLPETQPLSSPGYSPLELPEGYTNDPLNDPSNVNTVTDVPDNFPIDFKIAAGQKITSLPDQKWAQQKDSCKLIAQGCGSLEQPVYDLAWAFQQTRNIVLPFEEAKTNRTAAKAMVKAGVQPHHVVDATRELLLKGMTVVDMFSVKKTAISLANPAPSDGKKKLDKGYISPKPGL